MIEAEEVDDRDHQLDDVEELEDDVDEEDRAPLRKYQKIVVVRADGGSETREVLAKPGIRTPQVLLTNESLRGNPRYVGRQGRMKPLRRANNPTESDTSFDDDLPPQLEQVADVDRRGVPSMQPLFRLYAESSLKHATNSLQTVLEDDDQLVMEEGDDPDAIVMADMPPIRRNQVVHEFDGWPLYWDRPIDFQEACDIMMSVKRVEESKICRDVPLNFRGEGTFVIDLRCFDNRHDVALDGLGMWGKPTGRTRFYAIGDTGKPVRVDDGKGKLPPDTPYEFKCMAKRYEHPQTENTGSRFLKKIFTAVHPPDRGTAVALAVVCYEWIGPPVDFVVREAAQPRRNPSSVPLDGSRSWEAASFAAAGYDAEQGVTLCNEVFDDCPLYAVGAIDFGHAACVILGGVDIDHSRVCCRVPQGFRQAGTFIVDIRNFVTDAELRRDGNGAWGKPAGHSRYYKLDGATGDAVRVDRGHKLIEGSDYDVQILSKRYEHTAVNGRFVRKIYTGRSRNGGRSVQSCCNLAVITYYWKGEPEYFEATPQRRVRAADRATKIANVRAPAAALVPGESIYDQPIDESDVIVGGSSVSLNDPDVDFRTPQTVPRIDMGARRGRGPLGSTIVRKRMRVPLPGRATGTATMITSSVGGSLDSNRAETADSQMANLRRLVYEKEYENQERLASILDRAEAFLDRLERAGEYLPEQIWMANQAADGQAQQVLVHDGVVVQTEEGEQYVQSDGQSYQVNMM